ncbi:MAG: DM9 repeat-containing protein [Acidobacteriota bacterium]
MKTFGLSIILLLTFTVCSFAQSTPLVWTKPTGGKNYQLFSIKQPNGEYIGICRGNYQGGVYPGKLVNKKCNIGYGGKEIVLSDFEVFEMDANPNIKINDSWRGSQFQVGYESNGQKVFLCYAVHQNTYQPGKSVDGKCFFTWNGTEIQATSFLNYFYELKSATQTTTNPTPTLTPIPTYRPSTTPTYQPNAPTTISEKEKAAKATELVNNAIFYYRGQKYAEAEANFTEYLKLYPEDADGYYNRGVIYRDWGKPEKAIADFQQALKLKPDLTRAKTELDKLQKNKNEEIVTTVSQVTDVKPTDEFYGDLQSLIEKYGITKVTSAKKFSPNRNLTMFEYADFLRQGKEFLKNSASGFGIKKIDEEKLFNSKCTLPYLEMIPEKEIAKSLSCNYRIKNFSMPGGEKWVTRGKFAMYFNKAIQQALLEYSINSQAESVMNDLFKVETKQSPKTDSVKPNPVELSDWTKFLKTGTERMKVKDYDGAIESLTQCLNLVRNFFCLQARATAYGFKKDYKSALRDLDEALEKNKEEPELFSVRAKLRIKAIDGKDGLAALNNFLGASLDLDAAIKLDPKNPQWHRERAEVHCLKKEEKFLAKIEEEKVRELGGKVINPCK